LKIAFDPHQILYHGTTDLYGFLLEQHGIKIIKRVKDGVDFGPGFYVTAGIKEQAIEYARRRAQKPVPPNPDILELFEKSGLSKADFFERAGKLTPVLVSYRIKDVEAWVELSNEVFLKDSLRWREHVWTWRQATNPPEQYDWVFGPVADGGLYQTSPNTIKAFQNMNQLSIHNIKTTELLELLEVESC
jgi:hypothetical protein